MLLEVAVLVYRFSVPDDAGLEIKVSGPVGLFLGKIASKQYCPMQAKSWESSVLNPRPQDRRIFTARIRAGCGMAFCFQCQPISLFHVYLMTI